MKTTKTIISLPNYKTQNKAHLKAIYETYLLNGYDGIPYHEFVLKMWVESNIRGIWFQDIKILLHGIEFIQDLTLKTELQRSRVKHLNPTDWRREHYIASVMTNRWAIKSYRASMKVVTGKY